MKRMLSWSVGSDPACEIRIDARGVAARHCRLILVGDAYRLLPLHAAAEIYVNGQRLSAAANVAPTDVVTLGPAARMPWPERDSASIIEYVAWNGAETTFGRDPGCEGVIDSAAVSRRHARARRTAQGLIIEDLDSANGTFLNGQRIEAPTPARLGDRLALGPLAFTITALGLERQPRGAESLAIELRSVTVDVPGRRLLDAVSLTIRAGEFVGLMGPSGAGKTTLLHAMNGYARPASGEVLFRGHDLYEEADDLRRQIGYVPQDDIMHRELTVIEALRYTAGLRIPPETPREEIERRIDDVLEKLGLQDARDTLIGSPERKGISGGQRKRVNLAMELLTDPPALFLDEPTSGLSSEDALRVMRLLRQLADCGKLVLLTVHQPSLEAFRLLDRLALIAKGPATRDPGRLVYFGPAFPDAPSFFNPGGANDASLSPEDIFRGLALRPVEAWRERYEASGYYREFVARRAASAPEPMEPDAGDDVPLAAQCETLVRRATRVKISDRWNTTILLAQAPIVAVVLVLVFGQQARRPITAESWTQVNGAIAMALFLSGLSALWFGCSNSVREIVGEWAIYHRERMVNLKIPAYVLAKLIAGAALCAVQCLVLIVVVRWGCGLRAAPFSTYLVLLTLALTGLGLGLLLSAMARSTEAAIGLVPLALIPIVVFGGALLPVAKMQAPIKALAYALPLRWGFEALMLQEAERSPLGPSAFTGSLSAVDDDDPGRPDLAESHFPRAQRAGVSASVLLMVGMFLAQVAAIGTVLWLRDVV